MSALNSLKGAQYQYIVELCVLFITRVGVGFFHIENASAQHEHFRYDKTRLQQMPSH